MNTYRSAKRDFFTVRHTPEEWEVLERALNVRLLGEGEGPLPDLLDALGKSFEPRPPESADRDVDLRYCAWRFCLCAMALDVLVAVSVVSLYGVCWGAYALYRIFDRAVHRMRRPSYYNAEARKRADRIRLQRAESHRIRHRDAILHPPAPEELLEAWLRAKKRGALQEKLRLGSMMQTIEAAVDHDLRRGPMGELMGRNPGVKGWIALNCVELLPHYSSLMHYKAMADKVHTVCAFLDSYPLETLFAEPDAGDATISVGPALCRIDLGGGHAERKPGGELVLDLPEGTPRAVFGTVQPIEGERLRMRLRGTKISVGPADPDGERPLVDGRTGRRVATMENLARQIARGRANAKALLEEAHRAGADTRAAAFDDLLFRRLGIVRERRVN